MISRHTVDVVPSSTVYSILEKRVREKAGIQMPYLGVAAWTQTRDTRGPAVRAISAPQRSELILLPESRLDFWPPLSAMQDAQDFDPFPFDTIDRDERCAAEGKLASSRHPTFAPYQRMVRTDPGTVGRIDRTPAADEV